MIPSPSYSLSLPPSLSPPHSFSFVCEVGGTVYHHWFPGRIAAQQERRGWTRNCIPSPSNPLGKERWIWEKALGRLSSCPTPLGFICLLRRFPPSFLLPLGCIFSGGRSLVSAGLILNKSSLFLDYIYLCANVGIFIFFDVVLFGREGCFD